MPCASWPGLAHSETERESRRGRNQYGRRKFGKKTGQTRRRWNGKGSAGVDRGGATIETNGLHLLERRRLEFRRTWLGMVHLLALRSARLYGVARANFRADDQRTRRVRGPVSPRHRDEASQSLAN